MARIGVSPVVWSNDDDKSLGGENPLARCLSEARAAGYAGIELGHKMPRDPRALKDELRNAGLELVTGWWGSRLLERTVEEELEALEPHLNLLVAMGADVLTWAEVTGSVHATAGVPWDRRPVLHPGTLKTLARDLSAVAEHTRQRGLRMAYQPQLGTVIQTGADIHQLMAASSDAVGLTLSTGHAVVAGVSPIELLEHHGGRVRHVHATDVRPGPLELAGLRKSSFLEAVRDGVFTVPGEGMLDWPPIFEALKKLRYAGWVVVSAEHDPIQVVPARLARSGYKYVRAQLDAEVSAS